MVSPLERRSLALCGGMGRGLAVCCAVDVSTDLRGLCDSAVHRWAMPAKSPLSGCIEITFPNTSADGRLATLRSTASAMISSAPDIIMMVYGGADEGAQCSATVARRRWWSTRSGRLSVSVFGLALSYEDLNDHDWLRHDPVMAILP